MSFRPPSLPLLTLLSSSLALQALATWDATGDKVTVKVKAYWLRHGLSCANVLQKQAQDFPLLKNPGAHAQGLTFGLYGDPPLTDCAVARARALGPSIWERIKQDSSGALEPMVFSSELVRAMETAIYNFPNETVRPIPFIAEKGLSLDNQPSNWEDQLEQIQMSSTGSHDMINGANDREGWVIIPHNRIVFDDMINGANDREGRGKDKSNYDLFKKDFPDKLAMLYPKARNGDELSVVIVAHSSYMRDHLTCDLRTDEQKLEDNERKHEVWLEEFSALPSWESAAEQKLEENKRKWPKPRNNEVWLQEYTTKLPSREMLSSPDPQKRTMEMKEESCRPLFQVRDKFPEEPPLTCAKDILRCSKMRKPSALLKKDAKACAMLEICAGQLL